MDERKQVGAAVLRGAALLVLLRFAARMIGLLSLTVTARLLTPADFGIVGTASIVTGLFAILQSTGVWDYVVRKPVLEPGDLQRAWSINISFNLAIGAGLVAASGPAARFLNEPALHDVLSLLAAMPPLGALASPVSAIYSRELRFGDEFRLRVVQKLMHAACAVLGAILLRNYWGLIYGNVASTIGYVLVTYALYPFRPRLRFDRVRDFLGFSGWAMLQALASYLALVSDEVIVRRASSAEVFGLYHISRDLSRVLVSEFVAPAAGALMPGLALLQADRARFTRAARQAVAVAALVAVACGLGVAATAAEATVILLGSHWRDAGPYLTPLAVGGIGLTLAGLHRGIMFALGQPQWSAGLWFLRAAVQAAACAIAMAQGGAIAVAVTFAVVSLALTLFDYTLIFSGLGQPRAMVTIFARPMLAGVAMITTLYALPLSAGGSVLALALLKIALGATVYVAVLGLAWWAAGRPIGAEYEVLHRAPGRPGRLARRLLPRSPDAAKP